MPQPLFSAAEIEQAMDRVHQVMAATPQYVWPQLSSDVGAEVWVKHENHTPTGAFKIRGGITFMDWLRRAHPEANGIVTATRGNHGQSQARAARSAGLRGVIYVPEGNSVEKNAAMRAFGGELRVEGADFNAAVEAATAASKAENLFLVPPFHREIVRGVASYGYELMTSVPDLDTVYVPIGCGSGICSLITVRDALGLKTRVVGVVSTQAAAAKTAFETGRIAATDTAHTFADGMAVRMVVAEAFEIYAHGADRVLAVNDDEIADAVRLYFSATHNVAEGAGAAPLAALRQERSRMKGRKVAVILCGGNIDSDKFAAVLRGETPAP